MGQCSGYAKLHPSTSMVQQHQARKDAAMQWEDLPETLDTWLLKVAAPGLEVRARSAGVFTETPVGYYYHPEQEKVGVYACKEARATDLSLCLEAARQAAGKDHVLSLGHQDLAVPDSSWVKVAYSPTLRRLGEYLNFFPGQYPGGIPNHPSPVTAMLTSGLMGAGLGWGVGKGVSMLAPSGWGGKLGRSGALLGGLAGLAPGAIWAATSLANKQSPLSGWPLDQPAGASQAPSADSGLLHGTNAAPEDEPEHLPEGLKQYFRDIRLGDLGPARSLERVPLGMRYKGAVDAYTKEAFGDTFSDFPAPHEVTPMDVNINAIGQTLYDLGASSQLTGTTMGTLYAAQQLPSERAREGWAMGDQLGQLARNAAGDYLTGVLAGAALNQVVGTPWRASTYGLGNLALGVIGTVIPRLFGSG